MSQNSLKSTPAVPKKRIRFLPFPPTPRAYLQKKPKIAADCISCLAVSEQWSKLFEELCDKYEVTQKQLQKSTVQLLKAKAAGFLIGGEIKKSNVSSKISQTRTKIQVAHKHTQTLGFSFETSTQTEMEIQDTQTYSQTTKFSNEQTTHITTEIQVLDTHTQTPDDSTEETRRVRPIVVISNNVPVGETSKVHHISSESSLKIRDVTCSQYVTMHDHTYVRSDLTGSQNLYKCKVCKKFYCYDKMRKHYLQFINSAPTRSNRYGHSLVSAEQHQQYLDELKASK